MRVFGVICLLSLLVGCHRSTTPTRLRTSHATCEATCDYYQYCKGDEQEERYGVCVSDCRSIFSEDGEMDRDSLLGLQRLDCSELLSFIEGENKRPLAPQQSSLHSSGSSSEL